MSHPLLIKCTVQNTFSSVKTVMCHICVKYKVQKKRKCVTKQRRLPYISKTKKTCKCCPTPDSFSLDIKE